MIGFDQPFYSINESENAVFDIIVRVFSGNLRILVEVNFSITDDTALGM